MVHENLASIRAYYYGRDEKLLIYDCLPMGNLSSLLHGKPLIFLSCFVPFLALRSHSNHRFVSL